jgi:hypothetical protein
VRSAEGLVEGVTACAAAADEASYQAQEAGGAYASEPEAEMAVGLGRALVYEAFEGDEVELTGERSG